MPRDPCPITWNNIANGHSYTLPTANGKHGHTFNIWALEEWVSRGRITNPMTQEPIDAATVQNIKDVANAMRNLGHAPRAGGTRVALNALQLAQVKARAKNTSAKRPVVTRRSHPLLYHRLDTQLLTAAASGSATSHSTVSNLIRRGANIEATNNDFHTPLIIASIRGRTDTVRILVDMGANIERRPPSGWTALMVAAINGHTETVEVLIDKGANIEARNNGPVYRGWTALMVAAEKGHTETVELLLERGADVFARPSSAILASFFRRVSGRRGRPSGAALALAVRGGHTATVSLLREAERRRR